MAENNQPEKMEIDRLSLLPDTILIHIISFLPIKSAVITSVLSRQWRYLWTHITNVVFTPTCFPRNHILPQLPFPKIHRFHLKLPENPKSWIHDIFTRNPEQIVIEGGCSYIPTCILQCQSLVVLILTKDLSYYTFTPSVGEYTVNLPKLKKLQLYGCCDMLANIIRGCPLLEDINLSINSGESEHFIDLSAHNIKILCIQLYTTFAKGVQGEKLVINVSKLVYIKLHAATLASIRFVGVSSKLLINADIRLTALTKNSDYLGVAQSISGVRSLNLENNALKAVVSSLQYKGVTIFGMLSYLRISLYHGASSSWNDVMLLLRCCPSLEALQVSLPEYSRDLQKWDAPEHWPSCWTRLKRIDIRYLGVTDADFEMIKYILNYGKGLEFLSVNVFIQGKNANVRREENVLCEKILRLHKPSGCEIKFSGQYVSSSSKDFIPFCRSICLAPCVNRK